MNSLKHVLTAETPNKYELLHTGKGGMEKEEIMSIHENTAHLEMEIDTGIDIQVQILRSVGCSKRDLDKLSFSELLERVTSLESLRARG